MKEYIFYEELEPDVMNEIVGFINFMLAVIFTGGMIFCFIGLKGRLFST